MSIAKGLPVAEPNVAPMIDVLLVLLIVIMVMMPSLRSIDATLEPPPTPCVCDGPRGVLLEVLPGPVYRVDYQPVEAARLRDHLAQVYRERTDKDIVVAGYRGVAYQDVVHAMDIAKAAGIRAIDLPSREFYQIPKS